MYFNFLINIHINALPTPHSLHENFLYTLSFITTLTSDLPSPQPYVQGEKEDGVRFMFTTAAVYPDNKPSCYLFTIYDPSYIIIYYV